MTTKGGAEPLLGQFKQESNNAFAILKDAPGCLDGVHRETENSEAAGEGVSGQIPGFGNRMGAGGGGVGQQVNLIFGRWNWQIWWWELVLEGSDFFQEGGAGPVR